MTPPGRVAPQDSDVRPKTRPKQALIRPDQQTGLDHLARQLHDARGVKGERITANTLLRVAIDGLLEHGGRLHGDNEVQLLGSWREFLSLAASLRSQEAELRSLATDVGSVQRKEDDPVTAAVLARVAVAGLARHRNALSGTTAADLTASWLAFLDEREATTGR